MRALSADFTHSSFGLANSGHSSARYLSTASRTTQPIETFFFFAKSSSVLYTSGGKLTEVRGMALFGDLLLPTFLPTVIVLRRLHHVTPPWCIWQLQKNGDRAARNAATADRSWMGKGRSVVVALRTVLRCGRRVDVPA